MEFQEELEEQLTELWAEERELEKVIIALSKSPHATEALLTALESCKDEQRTVIHNCEL